VAATAPPDRMLQEILVVLVVLATPAVQVEEHPEVRH
jgi:hypothetical protein